MAQLRFSFRSRVYLNHLHHRTYSGDHRDFHKLLESSLGGAITLRRNDKHKVDIVQIENVEKKNALSGQMLLQLSEIVEKLEKDRMEDKRAVLFTGAGNSFCAGADLTLVENNLKHSTFSQQIGAFMRNILLRLVKLPVLSIALIDGPAFGAGAELAIGCDLRLTTPSGQLSFVHGRMGLVPAMGGGTRLVQLVGPARALDLLVTGRNLQGKDLVEWGLASGRVIGEEEALLWIEENLRANIVTQMALKSIVQYACAKPYADSVNFERDVFIRQWGGAAHLRALDRYRGKRD